MQNTSQPTVSNVMRLHTDRQQLVYSHSDMVFQSSKNFKYMGLAATFIRTHCKFCELYYRTPSDKNDSTLQKSVTSKRHRTPDTSSAKRSLIKVTPASHASSCADVYVSVLYLYANVWISVVLFLKLRISV